MAKFVYAYHGGSMPDTPEEQQKVMAAWGAWFATLGESLLDGGNPTAEARTVASDGSVTSDGGANPLTGYSLVDAASIDDAVKMAKSCPILENGGSVQVCQTVDM
ncbi:MAG: YciI family protein [Microthrixaceae bacterium]